VSTLFSFLFCKGYVVLNKLAIDSRSATTYGNVASVFPVL